MNEQIVSKVTLTEASSLIFAVSIWKGRWFAGIRKFITSNWYEGPTKAGIFLNYSLLQRLIDILFSLEKSLPTAGDSEFGRIDKDNNAYICIRIISPDDQSGLPFVDVREFVDMPKYTGPTKQGFRFQWNQLPEVVASLVEQAKIIRENVATMPSLFAEIDPKQNADANIELDTRSSLDALVTFLGEDLKQFPEDFCGVTIGNGINMQLPEEPLCLDVDNANHYVLKTGDKIFAEVRNTVEANFIIYAQMRCRRQVLLPKDMIDVFKTVKAYENYLRVIHAKLMTKINREAHQFAIAQYETDKLMRRCGLPII